VRYSDAGQTLIAGGRDGVPSGAEALLGGVYALLGGVYNGIGQPNRCAEWSRALLARGSDPRGLVTAALVSALLMAGSGHEAMAVADGMVDGAEASSNPWALSQTLFMYGMACCDADPLRAGDALRRGLAIAQDSGNRYYESLLAIVLGRLEAQHGDPLAALDHLTLAIRNHHNSGNTAVIRVPLAILATFLHWLGRDEPAATIAGYAFNRLTAAWIPELRPTVTQLREVLGDQTYESLARKGETMTTAAMATYAYDQIDQARTELEHPS